MLTGICLSPEEAVTKSLGPTSTKRAKAVEIDGQVFPSQTQAARYAEKEYGITFDMARDRIRRGVPLKK